MLVKWQRFPSWIPIIPGSISRHYPAKFLAPGLRLLIDAHQAWSKDFHVLVVHGNEDCKGHCRQWELRLATSPPRLQNGPEVVHTNAKHPELFAPMQRFAMKLQFGEHLSLQQD